MSERETCLSPVDLPGGAASDGAGEGAALGWTVRIVAAACLLLALLNAAAIRSWASELAPSPATEPAIAAADAWHDRAEALGLTAPVATLHGWWEGARSLRAAQMKTAPAPPEGAPAPEPRSIAGDQR